MSIFTGIDKALHSFGAWAEKELQAIRKEVPKIEQVADTVLSYVGPALQTIVSATLGTAAGAIVGKVIAAAQSDLTAASGLIYDFGATPTVSSILSSVSANLSELLAAGHITDATSVATANKVINEIDVLAEAIGLVKPAA